MSNDNLKTDFLPKYLAIGEVRFYRFLLVYALNKLILIEKDQYKGIMPDLEFLNYYDKFMSLYRKESETKYLELARLFRKAAHRIYRIMLKKKLTEKNLKFLNLV